MKPLLPFADPGMDLDAKSFRLGMLTFVGVVKDSMNRRRKVMFLCDCGRIVVVPIPAIIVEECSGRKEIGDLPWSCGECCGDPALRRARPWGMKQGIRPAKLRKLSYVRKKRDKKDRNCAKTNHRAEWFAWQQAKRLGKGTVKRWQTFANFYADMGDRPPGHRLTRRDKSKAHSPENSYWEKATHLLWGDKKVTALWVQNHFQVPYPYIMACKASGITEVQRIVAMHQCGAKPPKDAIPSKWPKIQ